MQNERLGAKMAKLDRKTTKKLIALYKREIDDGNEYAMNFHKEHPYAYKDCPCVYHYTNQIIKQQVKRLIKELPDEFIANIHEYFDGKDFTPIIIEGVTLKELYERYQSLPLALQAMVYVNCHCL